MNGKATKAAVISDCAQFRYRLTRTWNEDPAGCFVMLNPSTADAASDDPTIRRCVAFAKHWGWGGIVVANLFAYRATSPLTLKRAGYPKGPENDQHIIDACAGNFTIAAWGGNAPDWRAAQVWKLLRDNALSLDCLGFTRAGKPRHPLFVPTGTSRVPCCRGVRHAE